MRWQYLFIFLFVSSAAFASETYVTHRGYTFTQVSLPKLGTGWQAPNGVIWSSCIGEYTNQGDQSTGVVTHSPATDACEAKGGSLPSLDDYSALVDFFYPNHSMGLSTDQDADDFIRLFHDCHSTDRMPGIFWTTTAFQLTYARIMDGWDSFGDISPDTELQQVRCIVRPVH